MTDTRSASARRPATTPPGGRPDQATAGTWPVRERSLIKPVLGIPPLVAVGIAVGLTTVGVFVDLLRLGTVGSIFELGYVLGCVLAVAWVRRRSIFVPAIQPPLLLAVVVPGLAVLIGAPTPGAGATEHLLMAGAPLINAFPAMAVTTLVVLVVAGFRLLRQRTGPDDAVGVLRRRMPGGRAPAEGSATAAGDTARDTGWGRTGARREPASSAAGAGRGLGRRSPAPTTTTTTTTGRSRTTGDRAPADRAPADRASGDRAPGDRSKPGRGSTGRVPARGGSTDRGTARGGSADDGTTRARSTATPRSGAPRSSSTGRGSGPAEDAPARPRRPRRS